MSYSYRCLAVKTVDAAYLTFFGATDATNSFAMLRSSLSPVSSYLRWSSCFETDLLSFIYFYATVTFRDGR